MISLPGKTFISMIAYLPLPLSMMTSIPNKVRPSLDRTSFTIKSRICFFGDPTSVDFEVESPTSICVKEDDESGLDIS